MSDECEGRTLRREYLQKKLAERGGLPKWDEIRITLRRGSTQSDGLDFIEGHLDTPNGKTLAWGNNLGFGESDKELVTRACNALLRLYHSGERGE